MRNRCCSTAAAAVVSELPAGHNHQPLENAQPTTVDDVTEYIRIYPQHGNGKKHTHTRHYLPIRCRPAAPRARAARVREHTPPNERTGLPETPAPNS